MRRALSVVAFVACVAWVLPVGAQNLPGVDNDLAEGFCTDAGDDKCSEDNLIVTFQGAVAGTENVYEIGEGAFVAGMEVVSLLKMDAVSEKIQGWSLGVAHDEAVMSIASDDALTLAGTDAEAVLGNNPFQQNKVVTGGYISAVVLDLFGDAAAVLPVGGRRSILQATYNVDVNPGRDGTLVRVVNKELAVQGSPEVEVNITAEGGKSKASHWFVQGLVKEGGGPIGDCTLAANALYFGDAATSNTVNAGAAETVAISSRNTGELLGFQLGVAVSATKAWTFSDALGNNEEIETIFTDAAGLSVVPEKGNSAQATDDVTAVDKGAALAGFANDFFQAELNPEMGGTGFFVGYVADVQQGEGKIAATANTDDCPVQELLVVTTGVGPEEVAFNRGDANGDDKINVTDGILIVQVQVGNMTAQFPGCPPILDANGDGTNDLSDAIYLLTYVFQKAAPAPPAPFRTCSVVAGAGCPRDSNCAP